MNTFYLTVNNTAAKKFKKFLFLNKAYFKLLGIHNMYDLLKHSYKGMIFYQ
jgi:hypothetical protein